MLGFIRKTILKRKQNLISSRFPGLNIVLHPDIPNPSLNKMVELARLVNMVNSLEPRISSLGDAQLKAKTQEFKERLQKRSNEYEAHLEELRQSLLAVAIPEEKDRIKEI